MWLINALLGPSHLSNFNIFTIVRKGWEGLRKL